MLNARKVLISVMQLIIPYLYQVSTDALGPPFLSFLDNGGPSASVAT